MRTYLKNFVRFNKNNEVGWGLLIITACVTALYVLVIAGVAFYNNGVTLTFGWWAAIPIALWVVTVAHWVARPLVAAHYAK